MQAITRLLSVLLIILILVSCNKQASLPNDQEIYTALKEIIRDDSLLIRKLCNEPVYVDISWEATEVFGEKDVVFLKQQQKSSPAFRFEDSTMTFHNKYLHKDIPIEIISGCKSGSIYRVSVPLFSLDRTKVLISISEDCNCMLGGHGGTYVYEKVNGRWTRIKSWDIWIG